jgi:hypothetical protein
MRPGGRIALGFTRYSGQLNQGLEQALIAAGFADAQVKDRATDFCALAVKPMETDLGVPCASEGRRLDVVT